MGVCTPLHIYNDPWTTGDDQVVIPLLANYAHMNLLKVDGENAKPSQLFLALYRSLYMYIRVFAYTIMAANPTLDPVLVVCPRDQYVSIEFVLSGY